MDKLPESLLLRILSQLNDSADVARCRVASKAFDTVSPGLRSINLRCSKKWYVTSSSRASNSGYIKPFKTVFLYLISKLEAVESVCVGDKGPIIGSDYFNVTDEDFATEWLPRVSGSLKSLSISKHWDEDLHPSNILLMVSAYFPEGYYWSFKDEIKGIICHHDKLDCGNSLQCNERTQG